MKKQKYKSLSFELSCTHAQADLSLHWMYRSFCWFCHAAVHLPFCLHLLDTYSIVNPHCTNFRLGKKKNCLASQNLTDPTFFGTYSKIFGTSENFSSIFRVFFMIFMLFLYKKKNSKKLFCLPTYPKKY